MNDDRRIKVFRMGENELKSLLSAGTVIRPIVGVPRDAVLLGVHVNFSRRCFEIAFEHPDFPACPPGGEPMQESLAFEYLQHPMADTYDMVPLKFGMNLREFVDMQRWICERAAQIEGREYIPAPWRIA